MLAWRVGSFQKKTGGKEESETGGKAFIALACSQGGHLAWLSLGQRVTDILKKPSLQDSLLLVQVTVLPFAFRPAG